MHSVLFDPATVHAQRLDNGISVLVREDHSAPVVAIVTHLNVGYFDEPDELAGISHVLEHMFFKGTSRRGPGAIAQETKAAGGYLNAATIYDHTSYYTVLPAPALEQGLDIQSDALLHSVIDGAELARELEVIIQEAKRKLDNPGAVAGEGLYALMFDRHRMRRWRIGTEAFLRSLTREQLLEYYHTMYRGPRTTVSVAGAVDPVQAHALVARFYGSLNGVAPQLERGPAEPERNRFRLQEQHGDIVQTHLELGWRTPDALHDDSTALDVLAVVLGQGRAGRLYRTVREAGLVHTIGARNYTPTDLGVFQISAELDPNNALPALQAIVAALRAVTEFIEVSELERARSMIEARSIRRLESMEGQANHLAEWQALGDWRLAESYLDAIARLTPADLTRVARTYLSLDAGAAYLYHPAQATGIGWDAERLADALRDVAPRRATVPDVTPARSRNGTHAAATREEDHVFFFESKAGVPIIVKPRRAVPLVTVALAAAGGPSLESAERAGHTALAARTSIKGTQTRSAVQLALDAEALGASVQPGVGADLLDWSITAPARHFDRALELMLDTAQHPQFADEEVEKEKKIALADLQQVRDDMYRYPLRLLLSAAYPQHAYGFPLEHTEATLAAAGPADLRAWHERTLRRGDARVFIVGDVDPQEAADRVAALLDIEPAGLPGAPAAAWPERTREVAVKAQKAQTALMLGFPGAPSTHPDYVPLLVLANTIAGLGGRLFEELRSRRSLAYTVTAYPLARAQAGAFVGYIATAPEREEEARSGLLHELERLRAERLPAEEVERARRYTIGTWQIRSQTNGAQLSELLHALLIGRGLQDLREFEAQVQAVTPERIREVAERYFDATRRVEAIVRGTGGGR